MATILTIAFAFGSAIYAFSNKYVLVVVVLLFYFLIQRILAWQHHRKYLALITILQGGQTHQVRGFLDSGNALTDPQSRLPVTIISLSIFLKIFPGISADKILLQELDRVITSGHYINYETINGKGKLFVFQPEGLKVEGIAVGNCLLGVSPNIFSNTKYDALLNVKLGGLL